MRHLAWTIALGLGLTGLVTGAAAAQTRHEIRMEGDVRRGEYGFAPARVTARPGDVLVFRTVGGSPHSVVFESAGLSGPAREALNTALPRRSADLSSPLLTRDETEYRMTVPDLPPGTYAFFCLPHRAYDMRGELTVR